MTTATGSRPSGRTRLSELASSHQSISILGSKSFKIMIPSPKLQTDDYVAELSGIYGDGAPEMLARYYFRVQKN